MALLGATHCCTAQLTPVYFQVVSPEKHGCTSANAVRVPVLRVPAISAPTCPWDWRDSKFQPLGALGIGGTYSQFSPKVPVGLAGLRISAPRTLGAGEIQRNQPPSTLGTGGGTQSLQSAGTLGTGETQSISVPRYPWGWRDSFISVPRYPWDRRDSIHFIAKRCPWDWRDSVISVLMYPWDWRDSFQSSGPVGMGPSTFTGTVESSTGSRGLVL